MGKNDFFPSDYEGVPKSQSNYMKFDEGANKFRILSPMVAGYEWWVEEKLDDGRTTRAPIRVRKSTQVPKEKFKAKDSRERAKYFWAFAVYNFALEQIQVLEITQSSVITGLDELFNNDAWGDPRSYNITVNKKKTGSNPMDVEYAVIPEPPSKLDPAVLQFYNDTPINLHALYEGKDPFDGEDIEIDPDDIPELDNK